jgi:hypothetical protein
MLAMGREFSQTPVRRIARRKKKKVNPSPVAFFFVTAALQAWVRHHFSLVLSLTLTPHSQYGAYLLFIQ